MTITLTTCLRFRHSTSQIEGALPKFRSKKMHSGGSYEDFYLFLHVLCILFLGFCLARGPFMARFEFLTLFKYLSCNIDGHSIILQ
ncbi:hypothetical protein HanIR_Chr17g0851671 [Helianthus annuus]|nr:hypothetical protein HanIR_Chr17g0851671 [Helianthus annuus]